MNLSLECLRLEREGCTVGAEWAGAGARSGRARTSRSHWKKVSGGGHAGGACWRAVRACTSCSSVCGLRARGLGARAPLARTGGGCLVVVERGGACAHLSLECLCGGLKRLHLLAHLQPRLLDALELLGQGLLGTSHLGHLKNRTRKTSRKAGGRSIRRKFPSPFTPSPPSLSRSPRPPIYPQSFPVGIFKVK